MNRNEPDADETPSPQPLRGAAPAPGAASVLRRERLQVLAEGAATGVGVDLFERLGLTPCVVGELDSSRPLFFSRPRCSPAQAVAWRWGSCLKPRSWMSC